MIFAFMTSDIPALSANLVCAPHIATTAAELKNRKAFARRVTKVSKEIEEHSFLNALAYSELGKALRVKWFQHDIAPIGDYPPWD